MNRFIIILCCMLTALASVAQGSIDKVLDAIERSGDEKETSYAERRTKKTHKLYRTTRVVTFKSPIWFRKLEEAFEKERPKAYQANKDNMRIFYRFSSGNIDSQYTVSYDPANQRYTAAMVWRDESINDDDSYIPGSVDDGILTTWNGHSPDFLEDRLPAEMRDFCSDVHNVSYYTGTAYDSETYEQRGEKYRQIQKQREEALRKAEKARQEAYKHRDEALRKAEKNRQEALRRAEQARQEALRRAEQARQEAYKHREQALANAGKNRQEALRKAEKARQEALRKAEKARKEALRKGEKARQEALRKGEKARKEAQKCREEALKRAEKQRRKAVDQFGCSI